MGYESDLKRQEVELQKAMEAAIVYDQSLTPEQRKVVRSERRMRAFARSVISLNELIAPAFVRIA